MRRRRGETLYRLIEVGKNEAAEETPNTNIRVQAWAPAFVGAPFSTSFPSRLGDELHDKNTHRNISEELVEARNPFIKIPDKQLEYTPCESCKNK